MLREYSIAGPEHRLGLFEIGLFEYYLDDGEKRIANMIEAENDAIDEYSRRDVEYNDTSMTAVQYFEKRIRYSHIIYLNTLLEKCLKEGCARIKDTVGLQEIPFNWTELKGNSWEQCTKCLKVYAKVEIEDSQKEKIRTLSDIRNNIVHDGGSVDESFANRISGVAGLRIRSAEIHIDGQYVRDMLEIVKSIAEKIDHEITKIEDRILKPELNI